MIAPLVIGAVLLGCGFMVVRSTHLVHSVFWLGAVLLSTAALYVTLHAPFLAGIQVILYTGGVMTLMLFGVMLTQRETDTKIPNPVARRDLAGAAGVTLFAVLITAIWGTDSLLALQPVEVGETTALGRLFLNDYLLAFEALSVLLLAAMIGAIVLARKRDP